MIQQAVADGLTRIVTAWRWAVLGVFALLIAVSLGLAGSIGVVVNIDELLNPDNPQAARYSEIQDHFGSTTTLILTVEGDERAQMIAAAERIAGAIREDDELAALLRPFDVAAEPDYARDWGLLLLDDEDDVHELQRLLATRSLSDFLTTLNDNLEDLVMDGEDSFVTSEDEWRGQETLAGLELWVRNLKAALTARPLSDTGADPQPDVAAEALIDSFLAGDPYAWSPSGRMLMVTMLPDFRVDDLGATEASVHGIRAVLDEVQPDFPDLTFGLGGEIAQNQDEQDALSADMLWPALASLIVIGLVFLACFARPRNILLGVAVLLAGIVLTLGAIALTVGHISIVTSIFAVILIGLGIDFAVHFVSSFDDFRAKGADPAGAVRQAMHASGIPIILGGLTTGIAFSALGLSRSAMVAEFGIIAGLGVVITLACMILLLPALMMIVPQGRQDRPERPVVDFGFMARLGGAIADHRRWAIGLGVLATVAALFALPQNRVDYDMMNMGPASGHAVDTQRRIMAEMEISPFTALSMTEDVDEARRLAEGLRDIRLVSRVITISDFLVPEAERDARMSLIAQSRVAPQPEAPSDLDTLLDELQRLEWNVIEIGDLAVAGLGEDNRITRRRDAMIREVIGAETGAPGREVFQNAIAAIRAGSEESAARLAVLDAAFAAAMARQQARMQPDRAPRLGDIPETQRARLSNPEGTRFLVSVIAAAETQRDEDALMAFDAQTRAVDPALTGSVPLYLSMMEELIVDGTQAALLAAAVIFVLMLAFFRSLMQVALAFGAIVLAVIWMFAALPLMGVKLMMQTAMVFPLLIGIGTDDAMHILHRYRHEGGRIVPTLRYTGKAVLLSSLTTMIGFGALALMGQWGAVSGIGVLLVVGIGACFVATVLLLPAVLGNRGQAESATAQPSFNKGA